MATFKEIITRKASLSIIINEFIVNAITCWSVYGLCSWESNPLRWDPIMQGFALFFLCVYCPYRDAKRAIHKEKKGN